MKLPDNEMLIRGKEILRDTKVLVLVTGTLEDGADCYAYVSIPVENYLDFKQAEAQGSYNLADYGTIIFHGPGGEPPAEIVRRMEEERGADHLFEARLAEMLNLK